MTLLIICLVWVTCAVLTFGLSFAYFQRKYPMLAEAEYTGDLVFCLALAVIGGPMSLAAWLTSALTTPDKTFYGFKFK